MRAAIVIALVVISYGLQNMLPIIRRRLWALQPRPEPFEREQAPSPPAPKPTDKSDYEDGTFKPTPIDIVVARVMIISAKKLPPDLVDTILDQAEYWAHSTNAIDYEAERGHVLQISGSSNEESQFLLRSYPVGLTGIDEQDTLTKQLKYDTKAAQPLPRAADRDPNTFAKDVSYPTPILKSPVRKIVFTIVANDQGWGGDPRHRGTYEGSWTWFEAGLERFDETHQCAAGCPTDERLESSPESGAPKLPVCALRTIYPPVEAVEKTNLEGDEGEETSTEYRHQMQIHRRDRFTIQRNKTATRDTQTHVVTWSYLDDARVDSDEGQALEEAGRGRESGDGTFVRDLRLGDVVTIWGMARFPMWQNKIKSAKLEIYWAV